MSHQDQLERMTARLAKIDRTYLRQLEKLLERLPQEPQEDGLKQKLLRHYAERDPQTFYQLDAFIEVEGDAVLTPDDEGDCVMSGVTHELMTGAYAVRVLITSGTSKDDAVRLLSKLLETTRADGWEWLERDAQPPTPFDSELPAEFWQSPRLPDFVPVPGTRFKVFTDDDQLGNSHDMEPF